MTAKLLPPTELGPPTFPGARTPDPKGSSILGQEEDPEAGAGARPVGSIWRVLSFHPAVRVGGFLRLPAYTRHQEWSEGTRAGLKVALSPPCT